MKVISLILTIFIASFCSTKTILQNNNKYYFYFQDNNSTMNSFYHSEKQIKSYWYEIQRADNIVFRAHKEADSLKIKARDTAGLNVKDYNWLNKFDNTSRYKFFNLKPNKQFYIIEKKPNDNHLYLLRVEFIEEIE